jgi:hypothetical protein
MISLLQFVQTIFPFMAVILGLIIIRGILERIFRLRPHFSYAARESLLTPNELYAFQELRSVLPPNLHITIKPRLLDILDPGPDSKRTTSFQRISQKHVDFLVIDVHSGRPVSAIEIDDRSHLRPERVGRDEFVNAAFAQARIPLIRHLANQPLTPKIKQILSAA